jgi:hypothetical protein
MKREAFVFLDSACEWRCYIKIKGKIIAYSRESYKEYSHCVKMAKSFGYPTYLINGHGKPILQ